MSIISRLVFSGGGAKGMVYAGAYRALIEHGALPDVKAVSGASSGAIMAALVAFGASTSQINQVLLEHNLDDLLKDTTYETRNGAVYGYSCKGDQLYRFINKQINDAIVTFFAAKLEENHAFFQDLNDKAISDIYVKASRNDPINFSELSLLSTKYPEHFKALHVNACRYPKGEKQVFDHTNTPDVSVALACRASASLPIQLAPIEIEVNGKKSFYFDGGYFDNLPVNNFESQGTANTKTSETTVLAFSEGEDNPVLRALNPENNEPILYHPGWISRIFRDWLPKTLMGLKTEYSNTQKKGDGYLSLREYREQTIALSVGKITTTSFPKASKLKRQLSALGYLDTYSYLMTKHKKTIEDHEGEPIITEQSAEEFYRELLTNFDLIFSALLQSQKCEKNHFTGKLKDFEEKWEGEKGSLQYLKAKTTFIKQYAAQRLDSRAAFCLSLAVDYTTNNDLSFEELKEAITKESYRRSWFDRAPSQPSNFYLLPASPGRRAVVNEVMESNPAALQHVPA